jgi:hypothetical protein
VSADLAAVAVVAAAHSIAPRASRPPTSRAGACRRRRPIHRRLATAPGPGKISAFSYVCHPPAVLPTVDKV